MQFNIYFSKFNDNKKQLLEDNMDEIANFLALRELSDEVENTPLLVKLGKKYEVKSGKIDRGSIEQNNCFAIAVRMTVENLGYVEGYVIKNGFKCRHAWNVDNDGNHIDYTMENAKEYEYFGIIIPIHMVLGIGVAKGNYYNPVLPYINENAWDMFANLTDNQQD